MITTISSVNSHHFLSVQFTQSCLTLCNPMDCSTPGFLVHQQLPEPTQTYAHCISDAIRQSYPLSSLSPPAFNLSQHQGLQMSQFFTSGGQNIRVSASATVLPMKDWSPLGWTGWISLQSKGLSRVFSNTTVQKHQFFGAQFSFSPTLTSIHDYWKNHSLDYIDIVGKVMSLLFNMLFRLVIAFLPRSKGF